MKYILLFSSFFILLNACSKKTVPGKTEESKKETKPALSAPYMIVADGNGKIYTSASQLPQDENLKPDYLQISKGFTPQQQANLKARHQTLPPRVLYVNPDYQLKSQKGTYYIYKNKFWYWKKKDGLFYLDDVYYQ